MVKGKNKRIKFSILQKLIIFFFIILIINGIIGYAVYKSNLRLRDSEQMVRHTEQVISLSNNILSQGKDIEASSRGFVITNDSTFLEPLTIAEKTIFINIEQLRQLIIDNHNQLPRVDSLNFNIHKRLDFSLHAVELRSKNGLASAIAYISNKQGKNYSDHIRQITNAIQMEETTLLKQRKVTNEHSMAAFNRFSVVMFILMEVFTVFLLFATGKNLLQNKEKEKRAEELIIANSELAYQNEEKEKRAAELIIANSELAFQNEEKEKRASELIIAYKKLVFQNEEKEKRAAELIIANKELIYQNEEKGKRADELIIADKELDYQNKEKGKRAAELIIANKELVFQNEEKEKQEAANKELEAFSYSISHDLRAPLRHIGGFIDLLIKNNSSQLDETGLRYLNIVYESSHEMGNLIDALLTFSRLSRTELNRTKINSKNMVNHVIETFSDELAGRTVEINISELPDSMGDEDLINQVWVNLISNAIKYSRNKKQAIIEIGSKIENDKTIFSIKDNGAGFDMNYADKLFGVFQRLHKARDFEGIGIGLANVNRIVVRHGGTCWAESEVDKGATFFFSIPNK